VDASIFSYLSEFSILQQCVASMISWPLKKLGLLVKNRKEKTYIYSDGENLTELRNKYGRQLQQLIYEKRL
jgi:hypothetical protein